MKKIDLAKMLGVSRFTIRRWEKEGVLNQKIAEHQRNNELAKQNIDIENRKTILEIVELLKKMNQKLDMLQNVKLSYIKSSKNVSNSVKSVELKSEEVAEGLQNVAGYLTTVEVAHALGIARRTLNDWITDGKIKAIKVKGKNFIPKQEAFKFIFRDVFNRSSSINEFKEALKKVISLSDDEINNTLLKLDKEGVLSLKKFEEKG
jgi:excisionase family DNA binding protein